MLVLSRNTTETIRIGDNVEVTVLSVDGNQVKFGISAPIGLPVHREEIYKRIQNEAGRQYEPAVETNRLKQGAVAYINDEKGFGFIYSPGVDDNLFFHASSLIGIGFKDLEEGTEVVFKIAKHKKGRAAVDIKPAQ